MAPGLALFYGGMVRSKSVLNMMMMTFGALAAITRHLGRRRLLAGLRRRPRAAGCSVTRPSTSASRTCSTTRDGGVDQGALAARGGRLGGVFNFIAFKVFETKVAGNIAKGVDPSAVSLTLVGAALVGAIAWDLITWWLRVADLVVARAHRRIGRRRRW